MGVKNIGTVLRKFEKYSEKDLFDHITCPK